MTETTLGDRRFCRQGTGWADVTDPEHPITFDHTELTAAYWRTLAHALNEIEQLREVAEALHLATFPGPLGRVADARAAWKALRP